MLQIADRITVLRRGSVVGETTPAQTSKAKLAEMMVGRPVLFRLEKPQVEIGEAVLHVDDLEGSGKLHGLSFEVHAGEILGVAGVEGNGQRELAETLIGLRAPDAGEIVVGGESIAGWTVQDVRNAGVAYIPEDRQEQGLVLNMTIWENTVLGRHDDAEFSSRFGVLFIRKIKELAERLVKLFDVRTRSIDVAVSTLSGGNQQKLILARELETDPKLLIAAQPTRGLDVGAIEFVWSQILEQKEAGSRRVADLRGAGRDLRALGSDRDALRRAHHGRVRAGRGAGGHRRRHARRRRARGEGLMAAEAAARPIAEPKVRSEWLERLFGQTIALLASLAIALAVGSLLIIAYNESPIAVYGAILRFSVGSLDGFGYVLAIATPLIFSALAVAVCFKGGMFNIGVEGPVLRRAW